MSTHLTAIIRDDSPAIEQGEPPAHRRVTVELTDDQRDALELKVVTRVSGQDIRERFSQVFLEDHNV